jgi:hypothetical protein
VGGEGVGWGEDIGKSQTKSTSEATKSISFNQSLLLSLKYNFKIIIMLIIRK